MELDERGIQSREINKEKLQVPASKTLAILAHLCLLTLRILVVDSVSSLMV